MFKKFLTIICCFMLFSTCFGGIVGVYGEEETSVNHQIKDHLITIVDETTDLTVTVNPDSEENYYPQNRLWNGIPTVISSGNNIFVAWYTGGDKEPCDDNYIVVAVSTDNGKTFIDPFIIIDPVDVKQKVLMPIFFKNAQGEIYLYYVLMPDGTNTRGFYAIKLNNTDGDIRDITYEEPIRVSSEFSLTKPVTLSDGRVMFISAIKDGYSAAVVSNDGGRTAQTYSLIESTSKNPYKMYIEACVAELSDGTLWMLSRLEQGHRGGMEQAFSYDGGKTWTLSDGNMPAPLQGPGSRFSMQKLKSGALLLVNHDNKSNRNRLTAYLSYDDGATWPYSLLIDSQLSSYPDVYQQDDGTILIAYDKSRYQEGGIRLTMLTEEDIKAGKFVSDVAQDKLVVTKLNEDCVDIVSVNDAFSAEMSFAVGTTSDKVREKLPTKFTITDSAGKQHELSGTWKSPGYDENVKGEYVFTFTGDLPQNVFDSYNKLSVTVSLTEKTASPVSLIVGIVLIACSVLSLGVFGVMVKSGIFRKKNNRAGDKG